MNIITWKRRILSRILAVIMVFSVLPVNFFAAGATVKNPVLDIADGFILINDGQYAQSKDLRQINYKPYSGEITITGNTPVTNQRYVSVTGGEHTIRLKNATIAPKAVQDEYYQQGMPSLMFTKTTVKLILEGNSTLTGSGSYNSEYLGRDAVELSNSTVTVSGSGILNAYGGDSLRQLTTQYHSISGGSGISLQSGSTLNLSDNANLNAIGGNSKLDSLYWGNGILADQNSRIELSGGEMSVKGIAGICLRNSAFSQSGGSLFAEGKYGIHFMDENAKAEVGGDFTDFYGYFRAIIGGNLTVCGGDVTLRSNSAAVSSYASFTVNPPDGFYGNIKSGDTPSSSLTQIPVAEKTSMNTGSSKYVNVTFSNEKHSLTVQDGGAGSGSYLPGQKVAISAGSKDGQDFNWWESVSGDGRITDVTAADTVFTMGYQDSVIRPVYVTGKIVGDFVVATEEESGYSYENGVLTVSGSGTYQISMKNPGTATGEGIIIGDASPIVFFNGVQMRCTNKNKPAIFLNGGNPTVILNGVQIESAYSAIALPMLSTAVTTNATLKLSGENKVSSSGKNGAAISVCNSLTSKVSMTITSLKGDGSTVGRLEASGWNGIGSSGSQGSGAVTINGGTIIANGYESWSSTQGYGICNVTVNGGDVTSTGVESAFRYLPTLNNDPSIEVNGAFVHAISADLKNKEVHIYYDQNGGSSVKAVNITPENAEVFTGETMQFTAQVESGDNADKTVSWSVIGGTDGTDIDENGLLTVAEGETAQTLTVTATNTYSGLSESVSVSVKVILKWDEPTYTWAEDGKACTAKRVCEDDSSHTETATAVVTSKVTKQPTCTDMGETTYTAVFTKSWAKKQTKTLPDINALEHDFTGDYDAFDTEGHWHICNREGCTATDEKQNHKFTNYSYNNDATYLRDGTETATCDATGCLQTNSRTVVGTKLVDSDGPSGEITVKENRWKSFINTITFGIFCTDKYDVTITATDTKSGVASIEYLLSASAISKDDIEKRTGWRTYSAFSLKDEGKYIIYAKITDKAGNITYLSSDGLVIDRTAPVISGLVNNKIYCEAVTFDVEDANIDYVTVNGEKVTAYTLKADGTTYTVKAYDKVGNESPTYSVTVNSGHTFGNHVSDGNATCIKDGTKTAQCKFCHATDTVADTDSAFGHKWETAAYYTWSEDGKACTAKRICEHDNSHTEIATAVVTSKVTKQPTCTDMGETTYTATFAETWAVAQTKVVADIPDTGSETQLTDPADSVENKSDNTNSPQTGDNINKTLWLTLMFVGIGAVAGIAFIGKKKKQQY